MSRILTALISGTIFGAGLSVAQMTNPAKILSFLDVAGGWDPSLALVMGGALLVATVGVWLERRSLGAVGVAAPPAPPRPGLDARLIAGAAIFGLGWGLAGLCPGPSLAALVSGSRSVLIFVVAMVLGMALYELFERLRSQPAGASVETLERP